MNNRFLRFILISLAGKVISEALGNKKANTKNSLGLPSFHGVLEVKHSVKGRIRLNIPLLKTQSQAREVLLGQLSRVPSIKHIEINNITGSLILKYDEKEIEPSLLIGVVIKLLNLENQINNRPKALVSKEFGNFKEAINMSIYQKSKGFLDIKSVLVLGFIVLGVRGIKKNPMALPNGYTMLRWAYQSI